jgi:hypothetical protein
MQKFSIGLSPIISVQEYDSFFKQYSQYIDYIYFAPGIPGGENFTMIPMTNLNGSWENIKNILDKAIEYKIKIKLILNCDEGNYNDIMRIYRYLNKYSIKVDNITTLKKYLKPVRLLFPDAYLSHSCIDSLQTKNHIDNINKEFSELTFRGASIKNIKLIEYAKNKGFDTRLILNVGCFFSCTGCNIYCENKNKISKDDDINKLFALNTILPSEYNKYYKNNSLIDNFKLASRSNNVLYFFNLLDSYINNNQEKYIKENTFGYNLWNHLRNFASYYDKIDYNKVLEYKQEYWAVHEKAWLKYINQ